MMKTLVVVGIILICIGPLIVVSGTVYTLMLPNIYSAQARISVQESAPQVMRDGIVKDSYPAYNPYFLRTQMEIIQSNPIFYEVINRLDLQHEWGMDGEKLPREIALKILQNSVQVFQLRDTSLQVISVKRDNPDEAAKIANEMASAYRDFRLDRDNQESQAVVEKLGTALREQAQRVLDAETQLQGIRENICELHPNISISGEGETDDAQLVKYEPFRKAMADLEGERLIYDQLNAKVREKTIALEVPRNSVEIIDIAEPNRRPVSPNLFMNVML